MGRAASRRRESGTISPPSHIQTPLLCSLAVEATPTQPTSETLEASLSRRLTSSASLPGISIRSPATYAAKPSPVTPFWCSSTFHQPAHQIIALRPILAKLTGSIEHHHRAAMGPVAWGALHCATVPRSVTYGEQTRKYKLTELGKSGDDFGTWGPRIAAFLISPIIYADGFVMSVR